MRKAAIVLCLTLSGAAGGVGLPDFATLKGEAEGGDPYAQLNLGAAYDQGLGVASDLEEAERWYRRAAEQGLAEARFNLGHLLVSRGEAVEGAKWLRAAAEQGLADAQYLLGVICAEGLGLPRDAGEAERWLRRAAEQDHGEAQAYLEATFPSDPP